MTSSIVIRCLTLTFLGAAGTVTGSKHLLDLGEPSRAGRLRAVPGLKELRERNWAPLPIDAAAHRRRRADACASRSLRLPAAAGRAGISRAASSARRARAICARSCCPIRRTSRKKTRGTRTGTATRKHQPALPLYTRGRCRARADAAAAGRLRPPDAGRRRRRGRVHQRRPPARFGVRADRVSATRRSCSAAISAATAGRCCRIRRRSQAPTSCCVESTYGDRLHEADDDGDAAGGDHQRDRRAAAAS